MSEAAVFVTGVGGASGSRAAAAALACAVSGVDRAGLLVDLSDRPLRPTLFATAAAQELEERLAIHLPEAGVASRGQVCHSVLSPDTGGLESLPAVLTVARESVGVVHLPAGLLREVLTEPRVEPIAVILRADLGTDRPLTALVAGDLIEREIPIAVLKRPLGWLAARRALAGLAPESGGGLQQPACRRLLEGITASHPCYAGRDDTRADSARAAQSERRGDAGARRRRGLRRYPQRQAGR